jgi:alkylhydroperoxidase/carboxymuconolactone decarboxylase family protein YurZ
MPKSPLEVLEKMDPELIKLVNDSKTLAISDGALSKKVKLLIALALDAAHGTDSGVKSLASQAMQAGATKEELMETLRVAHYIAGVGAVFTAAHAFEGLL